MSVQPSALVAFAAVTSFLAHVSAIFKYCSSKLAWLPVELRGRGHCPITGCLLGKEDLPDTFGAWWFTRTGFSVVVVIPTTILEESSVVDDVAVTFVGVEGGVGGGERDDRGENVSRVLSVTVS